MTKGAIVRKNFETLDDLRSFMVAQQPQMHEGLSLVYNTLWHHNIAHALWDGLYPAFLALCEWGKHDQKFRSVVKMISGLPCNHNKNGKCMSEGVFEKFGGGEFVQYTQLRGWHNFAD